MENEQRQPHHHPQNQVQPPPNHQGPLMQGPPMQLNQPQNFVMQGGHPEPQRLSRSIVLGSGGQVNTGPGVTNFNQTAAFDQRMGVPVSAGFRRSFSPNIEQRPSTSLLHKENLVSGGIPQQWNSAAPRSVVAGDLFTGKAGLQGGQFLQAGQHPGQLQQFGALPQGQIQQFGAQQFGALQQGQIQQFGAKPQGQIQTGHLIQGQTQFSQGSALQGQMIQGGSVSRQVSGQINSVSPMHRQVSGVNMLHSSPIQTGGNWNVSGIRNSGVINSGVINSSIRKSGVYSNQQIINGQQIQYQLQPVVTTEYVSVPVYETKYIQVPITEQKTEIKEVVANDGELERLRLLLQEKDEMILRLRRQNEELEDDRRENAKKSAPKNPNPDLLADLDACNHDKHGLELRINELTINLQNANDNLRAYEEKIAMLSGELSRVKGMHNSQGSKFESITIERDSLLTELNGLKSSWESRFQSIVIERDGFQGRIRELEIIIERLNGELSNANNNLRAYEDKIAMLSGEVSRLKNLMAGRSSEMEASTSSYQIQISQYQTQLSTYESRLENMSREREGLMMELNGLKTNYESKFTMITRERDSLLSEMDGLRTSYESRMVMITSERDGYLIRIKEFERIIEGLRIELETAKNNLIAYENKIAILSGELNRVKSMNTGKSSDLDEMRIRFAEMQQSSEGYQMRISQYESQIGSLRIKWENSLALVACLAAEIEGLRNRYVERVEQR